MLQVERSGPSLVRSATLNSSTAPSPATDGYSQAAASADADALFRALEPGLSGAGVDTDALYKVLDRSKAQLAQILPLLKEHYHIDLNDPSYLQNKLNRNPELGPNQHWLRTLAMLRGNDDPQGVGQVRAVQIASMYKAGEINTFLRNIPREERAEIAVQYAAYYVKPEDQLPTTLSADQAIDFMLRHQTHALIAIDSLNAVTPQMVDKVLQGPQLQETRALLELGQVHDPAQIIALQQQLASAASNRLHQQIDHGSIFFHLGRGINMQGVHAELDGYDHDPQMLGFIKQDYLQRFDISLEEDSASVANHAQKQELQLLFNPVDPTDPLAAHHQQLDLQLSQFRQHSGDAKKLREMLEPLTPEQTSELVQRAGPPGTLSQQLCKDLQGDDALEIQLLLEKPNADTAAKQTAIERTEFNNNPTGLNTHPSWQTRYDEVRIHRALHGSVISTDTGLLRNILGPKTREENVWLAAYYQQQRGDALRADLIDNVDWGQTGRDTVEIVRQMFDLGAIELHEGMSETEKRNAITEKIRRAQELSDNEAETIWASATSQMQTFAHGFMRGDWHAETDQERLRRNLDGAKAALNIGDYETAAKLAGFSEGDLVTLVSNKAKAREYGEQGGALLLSTVSGGAAEYLLSARLALTAASEAGSTALSASSPFIVSSASAAGGAAGAYGGGYLVDGQAGGTAYWRAAASGAVGGATMGPMTASEIKAARAALAEGRSDINFSIKVGARNGAATAASNDSLNPETWRDGWKQGLATMALDATLGAASGAAMGGVGHVTNNKLFNSWRNRRADAAAHDLKANPIVEEQLPANVTEPWTGKPARLRDKVWTPRLGMQPEDFSDFRLNLSPHDQELLSFVMKHYPKYAGKVPRLKQWGEQNFASMGSVAARPKAILSAFNALKKVEKERGIKITNEEQALRYLKDGAGLRVVLDNTTPHGIDDFIDHVNQLIEDNPDIKIIEIKSYTPYPDNFQPPPIEVVGNTNSRSSTWKQLDQQSGTKPNHTLSADHSRGAVVPNIGRPNDQSFSGFTGYTKDSVDPWGIAHPYLQEKHFMKLREQFQDSEFAPKMFEEQKAGGFMAIAVRLQFSDGVGVDIQAIGTKVNDVMNAEHIYYDALRNKPFDTSNRELVSARQKIQSMDAAHHEIYKAYLRQVFINARAQELGFPLQEITLPASIDPMLSIDNLIKIQKKFNTPQLPQTFENLPTALHFTEFTAPTGKITVSSALDGATSITGPTLTGGSISLHGGPTADADAKMIADLAGVSVIAEQLSVKAANLPMVKTYYPSQKIDLNTNTLPNIPADPALTSPYYAVVLGNADLSNLTRLAEKYHTAITVYDLSANKKQIISSNAVRTQASLTDTNLNKILFGKPTTNTRGNWSGKIIGAHSGQILHDPDYVVEVLEALPNGVKRVKLIAELSDGSISNLKESTLFPESWDNEKVALAIKQTVNERPIASTQTSELYQKTIDGVDVEVVSQNGEITTAYPCMNGFMTAENFIKAHK